MSPDAYLTHLRQDADRLAAAVRSAGLGAPVPTCPGWDVGALVQHVAAVYGHKLACIRLGRRPESGEWPLQPPAGTDLPAWFDDLAAELIAELTARGPAAPAYTWFPPDQTAGFWFRRMAQETVVHRLDAELAAGAVTPVPGELALDGVDEMLRVFLAGPWWESEPVDTATGRTVAVTSGGRTWSVRLDRTAVTIGSEPAGAAATVSGAPVDVLTWVWGRPPFGEVAVAGDPAAVTELRERLTLVSD